jgi:predicted nucleic acid-binding protein
MADRDIAYQLNQHRLIGLDSSIFIYHLEAHPEYLSMTEAILNAVQSGKCHGVVSTISLMEVTVHPWRVNRADVARKYEMLLANFPNLTLVDVNRDVARRGAQLRAKYNLRSADALLVATAVVSQATLWVTNDKTLKRIAPEIGVLVLAETTAV